MFSVTKQVDYGLLLVTALARDAQKGVISLKRISNNYHLPYKFLQKICIPLRKKGIIRSEGGTKGGYQLIKKPSEIKVADVINALEETTPVACLHGDCPLAEKCHARSAWQKIHKAIEDSMNNITIKDLI
ncbi:MAG: Rrf2 family transcriptional regulator [bacterium]